jgi:hypothetical protein
MPAFLLIADPLTEIYCSQSSDLHAPSEQQQRSAAASEQRPPSESVDSCLSRVQ